MKFSNYFRLNHSKQSDYEFLDIRVDRDNKLFIDPTRIEAEENSFSIECDRVVIDFFNTVLDLYAINKIDEARTNLIYSGESNEIFLGYTEGFPQGKGNSEEDLDEIFKYIHTKDLISKGLIGRIEDLQVFIDNFGCDKMSDLIASLIKHKLIEFTITQCNNLNIVRDYQITKRYWNRFTHKWDEIVDFVPSVKGPGGRVFPVVLVPKKYVVTNQLYDSEKYWEKVVSIRRQEYHKKENTNLFKTKANNKGQINKRDIREFEVAEKPLKEYLIGYTINDINAIEVFRDSIRTTQRSSFNNSLSDEEIDNIIKDSFEEYPSTNFRELYME